MKPTATAHEYPFWALDPKTFERLVYFYFVASDDTAKYEWPGQAGQDGGRDIIGEIHPEYGGGIRFIACSRSPQFLAEKAITDISKCTKTESGTPVSAYFISGAPTISGNLRLKVKSFCKSIGVSDVSVWSGPEFEAHIRKKAPTLFKCFLEGDPVPPSSEQLLNAIQGYELNKSLYAKIVENLANQVGAVYSDEVSVPHVDGVILFGKTDSSFGHPIGVCIRSGKDSIEFTKTRKAHISVSMKKVNAWKKVGFPIIVIWMEDVLEPTGKILWGNAKKARNGHLLVATKDRFRRKAIPALMNLVASDEQRLSKASAVPLEPPFESMKNEARRFFRQWKVKKIISPIFGEVQVTWKFWDRITHPSRSKSDILHRLSLLPVCDSLLRDTQCVRYLRKIVSGSDVVTLHAVEGIVYRSHTRPIKIRAVISVDRFERAKLMSLAEFKW